MAGLPFLAVSFIMSVVAVLFIMCAVLLILVVLIQKGKGGGLSAALAGGLASGVLGAKSKEPLTWFTIVLVGVFLFLAVVLAKFYKPEVSDFDSGQTQQIPTQQQMPPAQGFPQAEELPQPPQSESEEPPLPADEFAPFTEVEMPDVNMEME
jgi:preprotein translocase subunit SecG